MPGLTCRFDCRYAARTNDNRYAWCSKRKDAVRIGAKCKNYRLVELAERRDI